MSLNTVHSFSVNHGFLTERPEQEVVKYLNIECDAAVVASRALDVGSNAFHKIVDGLKGTQGKYTFGDVVVLVLKASVAFITRNTRSFNETALQLQFCFSSKMLVQALADPKGEQMANDFYRSLMFTALEKAHLDRPVVTWEKPEAYNRAEYIEAAKTAISGMLVCEENEKHKVMDKLHAEFCRQEQAFMNKPAHMYS